MGAYGLFLVSGLAVGALYALGGVGLVILNRATGVLNFAIQAVCSSTMVLDFGSLVTTGPTRDVLSDPRVRAVHLGVEELA